MLTSSSVAGATVLSLLMNGVPVQATYLQSDRNGCDVTRETARTWNKESQVHAVETRVGDWCSVGAIISGQWVSEQWRVQMVNGKTTGWRIVMPLNKDVGASSTTAHYRNAASDSWHLDIVDPQIATRIRYRQSLQSLDMHHQESQRATGRPGEPMATKSATENPLRLSRDRNGEVLLSGRHPDGGSYSVLIERGFGK